MTWAKAKERRWALSEAQRRRNAHRASARCWRFKSSFPRSIRALWLKAHGHFVRRVQAPSPRKSSAKQRFVSRMDRQPARAVPSGSFRFRLRRRVVYKWAWAEPSRSASRFRSEKTVSRHWGASPGRMRPCLRQGFSDRCGCGLEMRGGKTNGRCLETKDRHGRAIIRGDVVRVAIQNFLKNPVISMVFGHPNRKISCISPHIRAAVLKQPPFFCP